MAQALEEELNEMEDIEDNANLNNNPNDTNDANDNGASYFGTSLTEEELKSQVQELNDLMDPSKLTTTQQHCIAQIVACFIANHIHRYYHSHKYVSTISNKLNNVNIINNDITTNDITTNDTDNNNSENKQNDENQNELHLIYPIPILKSPPKILFYNEEDKNNDNDTEDDTNKDDKQQQELKTDKSDTARFATNFFNPCPNDNKCFFSNCNE